MRNTYLKLPPLAIFITGIWLFSPTVSGNTAGRTPKVVIGESTISKEDAEGQTKTSQKTKPSEKEKKRSKNTKKAVAQLSKNVDDVHFTIWPRGPATLLKYGLKQLTLDRNAKSFFETTAVIRLPLTEKQAKLLLKHLADTGFFDRAKDVREGLGYQAPTKRMMCLILKTKKGKPVYFEELPIDDKLLPKLAAIRKAVDVPYRFRTYVGTAFSKLLKPVEMYERTVRIWKSYEQNRKKISFLLRYHSNAEKVAKSRSLWLFTSPLPDVKFNARTVDRISKEQSDNLMHHLTIDGFLARAKKEKAHKLQKLPPGDYFTLQLHGIDDDWVYYEGLGFKKSTIGKLDMLRSNLQGKAMKQMDAVLDELAPYRKKWETDNYAPRGRFLSKPEA